MAHLVKEEERKRTGKDEKFEKARGRTEKERVKKGKHDAEKKSWEEKHQVKAEVIEVLKEKLNIQTEALTDSLKAASNAKKESLRKAGIEAALESQKNVGLTRQLLDCAQQEMEKLIGKKSKLK